MRNAGKLSQSQHAAVLRRLLSAVSPFSRHLSNSWLIYKCRELGNNKKTTLALFVLTKPNEEWSGESIQKVIMSPLFSDGETHLKLPRFLLQRDTTPRLHVRTVSSECAFTAAQERSDFLLRLSPGNTCRCVRPPAAVSSWIVFSRLSDAFMEDLSALQTQHKCRCMRVFSQQSRCVACDGFS